MNFVQYNVIKNLSLFGKFGRAKSNADSRAEIANILSFAAPKPRPSVTSAATAPVARLRKKSPRQREPLSHLSTEEIGAYEGYASQWARFLRDIDNTRKEVVAEGKQKEEGNRELKIEIQNDISQFRRIRMKRTIYFRQKTTIKSSYFKVNFF